MKKPLALLCACALLCARAPAISAQAAAGAARLAPVQAVYDQNIPFGIWLTLENMGDEPLRPTGEMRLEKAVGGRWLAQPRNPKVSTDAEGPLSDYAVNPVGPGETARFSADVALFLPDGESQYGKYRVVLPMLGTLSGAAFDCAGEPFELLNGPKEEPDPALVSLMTERPFYDQNITEIHYDLVNGSTATLGYGTPYSLEREEDGKWYGVPFLKKGGKPFPGIGILLGSGQTSRETLSVARDHRTPLRPGNYRIVKTVGVGSAGEKSCAAAFTVVDADNAPRLETPIQLKAEAGWPSIEDRPAEPVIAAGKRGVVTLGTRDPLERRELEEFLHELLALQACPAPEEIPAIGVRMTLTYQNQPTVTAQLYTVGHTTYAKIVKDWYQTEDPRMTARLRERIKALGGFLPADGPALIDALLEKEPFRELAFEERRFSFPFSYNGWQAKGEGLPTLSILNFPSAALLNRQMETVYDNGYRISPVLYNSEDGVTYGETVAFRASAPTPHYFTCGRLLLIYSGNDPEALAALTSLLGAEVDTL